MAQEKLITADRIRVPDRAGALIINRYEWPVSAKSNNDTVIVGYLPANCRIHAPSSQVIADGDTGAMTFDVSIGEVANKILAANAVTASTFKQAPIESFELCETLGRTEDNRPVILNLSTAPTVAGGKIIVDLACFDPGV